MSSTTVTPTPAPTPTPVKTSWFTSEWIWITSHIFTLLLAGALTVGAIYFVESIITKHDTANATQTAATLATQVAQTKTLEQEIITFEAAEQQRDAEYQKTIAQLTQSITARDNNAQKQQIVDSTLDATAAAQRLIQQTHAGPSEVTTVANTVVLDLPVARDVVSGLDALPVAQADLKDTQSQLTAQKAITKDVQTDDDDQKKLVASQKVLLTDANKNCTAQIAVVNAKARTGKIKAFLLGAAAVAAVVFGHAL